MARSSLARTQSLLGPLGIARPSRKSGRSQISLVGTPTVARGILPAANAAANPVTITAVSGVNYLGAMTITGLNFGSVVGTVTVGGVSQTIGSWTNTGITINSLNRAGLFYGVAVSLIVTSSGAQSGTYLLTSGVFPQTGWNYITLTSVNPTLAWRLTSTPDLAIGDQITWGNVNPSGTVTVNADATFETSALAQSFYFEVNDGTGWGPQALVTIGQQAPVIIVQQAYDAVWDTPISLLSLNSDGSKTVTATTNGPHGLSSGAQIGIQGSLVSQSDGIFSIIVITAVSFSYIVAEAIASASLLTSTTIAATAKIGIPRGWTSVPVVMR